MSAAPGESIVGGRGTYPRWTGVFLGLILSGSAHYLSGRRAAGLRWYLWILACQAAGLFAMAVPGIAAYVAGVLGFAAAFALWAAMLAGSWRPVPRIGLWGWCAVVVLAPALNVGAGLCLRQAVTPFRVPTGAMQPTVLGVHGRATDASGPGRPSAWEWPFTGRRYVEVVAKESGVLAGPRPAESDPGCLAWLVGGAVHELPKFARPLVSRGGHVGEGSVLWSGIVVDGDCLFVERVICRFHGPRRGDIVVFRTDGIPTLPPGTHYVKRVAGLPGERVRIEPPHLVVDGRRVTEPGIFEAISSRRDGFAGFRLPVRFEQALLAGPDDEVVLGEGEYLVLGDNTLNSRDSRYWGPVPRRNIVGRATRVYWPVTRLNARLGRGGP